MRATMTRLLAVLGRFTAPAVLLWLRDQALAERDRWALWAPVLFALGIAAYILALREPPAWGAGLAGLTAMGAGIAARRSQLAVLLAAIVILLAAGFGVAQWRTWSIAAPVLDKRFGPVTVGGRVLNAQVREDGLRLTLYHLEIERLALSATPARIRVTTRSPADVQAGDWIRVRAVLSPPAEPNAPGAFDFARAAWFLRLGAVGYTVTPVRRVPAPDDAPDDTMIERATLLLNALRQELTARIQTVLPGPTGAVAAALMTGERAAIPPDLDAAYRDSGLAHLLSISGLHLALVAGILFAGLRFLFALWEWAALRFSVKKWAAFAALLGTAAYMLLSGADTPTQRSFLMTALVLLAVLVDRTAISMRGVAWAALLILFVAPESLFNAGFQMSFAAVVALIAAYEVVGGRLRAAERDAGILARAGFILAGSAATTLIAGTASGAFAAYHFNRFVDFGALANLIAVPLSSLWIMPWAVVAFLLMPFGLEWLALVPMGWGVDAVNALVRAVAAWPGAVSRVPAMPDWGIAAVALGGLWLCLWRHAWRFLGVLPIAAGLASLWFATSPDLLIHPDGHVAVKTRDGGLMIGGGGGIVAETWLRRAGLANADPWPAERPLTLDTRRDRLARHGRRSADVSTDGRLRCDAVGCTWRTLGYVIALPRDAAALAEDCRTADIVVSLAPVRGRCPSARIVIDRWDLQRDGAHALYLPQRGMPGMQSVAQERGRRPWTGAAAAAYQNR